MNNRIIAIYFIRTKYGVGLVKYKNNVGRSLDINDMTDEILCSDIEPIITTWGTHICIDFFLDGIHKSGYDAYAK